MRYFHRTPLPPADVLARAERFFGERLAPTGEEADRRRFAGGVGQVLVSARPDGGHYTLVTVETNQPGESEADKLAKRFLTLVHAAADPGHAVRGAY
ncbi:MAG: hypothetical protein MUC69_02975 [Gemmatimonadales bacterium]|jgi:hypothetical protein|nr:hypothetical protein [Gemmatimonadales bacterium]